MGFAEQKHYASGDRLDDGRGNIGYVRLCHSRSSGKTFLRVFIGEGPRKGQWDWPDKFAPPTGDWCFPTGEVRVCPACDRSYRARPGHDDLVCRICDARDDAIEQQRMNEPADDGPRVGSRRRRIFGNRYQAGR